MPAGNAWCLRLALKAVLDVTEKDGLELKESLVERFMLQCTVQYAVRSFWYIIVLCRASAKLKSFHPSLPASIIICPSQYQTGTGFLALMPFIRSLSQKRSFSNGTSNGTTKDFPGPLRSIGAAVMHPDFSLRFGKKTNSLFFLKKTILSYCTRQGLLIYRFLQQTLFFGGREGVNWN